MDQALACKGKFRQLPVIVVGGGIGGLATALGLARKGYASVVLEKRRV